MAALPGTRGLPRPWPRPRPPGSAQAPAAPHWAVQVCRPRLGFRLGFRLQPQPSPPPTRTPAGPADGPACPCHQEKPRHGPGMAAASPQRQSRGPRLLRKPAPRPWGPPAAARRPRWPRLPSAARGRGQSALGHWCPVSVLGRRPVRQPSAAGRLPRPGLTTPISLGGGTPRRGWASPGPSSALHEPGPQRPHAAQLSGPPKQPRAPSAQLRHHEGPFVASNPHDLRLPTLHVPPANGPSHTLGLHPGGRTGLSRAPREGSEGPGAGQPFWARPPALPTSAAGPATQAASTPGPCVQTSIPRAHSRGAQPRPCRPGPGVPPPARASRAPSPATRSGPRRTAPGPYPAPPSASSNSCSSEQPWLGASAMGLASGPCG